MISGLGKAQPFQKSQGPFFSFLGRNIENRSIKKQIVQSGEVIVHLSVLCDYSCKAMSLFRVFRRVSPQYLTEAFRRSENPI